jgi:hypothetical protein
VLAAGGDETGRSRSDAGDAGKDRDMRSRCATPDTRAIIQREVEKRVKEESQKQTRIIAERLTTAIDAASMWVLHEEFGFGKERLERYFYAFNREYQYLVDFYELGEDTPYVCIQRLKEIGVDVEALESGVYDDPAV